jgi:hypothetical protein
MQKTTSSSPSVHVHNDLFFSNVSGASSLLSLDNVGLQLCAEHVVPELCGDAKAELVLQEMVLQVVLLEILIPERQVLVVEEIVSHVIADITKDATTVDCGRSIPVVGENSVCEIPERSCKQHKHGWRHDKSVPIHGQVVMDTVKQEVGNEAISVIREVAKP